MSKRSSQPSPNNSTKKQKSSVPKYGYKQVHDDLKNNKYCGVYGGANSAWHGLAGLRAKVNLKDFHTKRSPDEFFNPGLDTLLKKKKNHSLWDRIVTFDPMGLYADHPTIAATTARMEIPELKSKLVPDDKVVNEDKSINITKVAVDYVWNIPGLAERLNMDETNFRDTILEYTGQSKVTDTKFKTYLPPVAGCTVYLIGDFTKLGDPETEVAVRVHDSCCGSDVFGTDICTCRPYLTYAIQGCVDTAQRGGVGVVVYFQKEGRGLGEVTKFRVYNARKAQEGGDCPEKYFYQTESIAGIRDARFQEMMPDVLVWLGIKRIDWLLSMSSEKYDAIIDAGIEVMQRVPLPDEHVPAGAHVEITAKISAGYESNNINHEDIMSNLRELKMIRERCHSVLSLARANKTPHFKLDESKLDATTDFVIEVTKKNYPDMKIPYHSRWRHFNEEDTAELKNSWLCGDKEKVRRLIDLVTISVFSDAGAGDDWKYVDKRGNEQSRSEGLALASCDMFADGIFSSDVAVPHRVNAHGLKAMSLKNFCKGFQHDSKRNPLVGVESRYDLMQRLSKALFEKKEFFGGEVARPGNIVDYILPYVKDGHVSIKVLWRAVIEGFESIWPASLSGAKRGDVWVYSRLKKIGTPGSDFVPFHKLSQWLTYSLLEPLESLGITFDDMHLMTGLAEYRNGGLLVDFGVLTLRDQNNHRSGHAPGSELIVEWRALTVCLLDIIAEKMRKKLGMSEAELGLAKVLQGGTWAAGRAIAAKKREKKGSPITVRSDGTVF